MPCINQDVLSEIGKQLMEDGDSAAVIRLIFSGKECFNAMKTVFASVTSFKIGKDCYEIGWNKSCCTFEVQEDEPSMKCLLYQIGNYVKELHIDYGNITVYQPILDKIFAKKRLITFSTKWRHNILGNFMEPLLSLASSLKHVTIPSKSMTSVFRDAFNLQSLIVINYDALNIVSFCCKTESLEISNSCAHDLASYKSMLIDASPYLSSIKKLMVKGGSASTYSSSLDIYALSGIRKFFISLETLEHTILINSLSDFHWVKHIIDCFNTFVNNAIKVPSKATYSFTVNSSSGQFSNIEDYKNLCTDFEFDESISDFSCFRKTLQSAGTQSTIFEVRFYQK